MSFLAKSTYNGFKLAFGMLAQDMLVVATKAEVK